MLLRQHGPTSRHTSSVFPCSTYEPADSRPSTARTSRHTTSGCLYSLRYHLLSTDKFGVLATIRQTNALSFRLPRSEASVVHPFRPSFHVPSSPSIQRTDTRARGSLLVIAISGSMRLHSLVTAITGSVRPSPVGGTARHRHLWVGAASLAPSACRGVPPTAFARTHRHSDALF